MSMFRSIAIKCHFFCGILLLGLLSACGSSTSSTSASLPPVSEPVSDAQALNVLVIGAGAAGLAAGYEVQNAGHNVIVLEARDRIGGRVWSDRRDNEQSVDLGAAWIHGINGNPAQELAQQQGLETTPTDYDNLVLKQDPNASQLTTSELVTIINILNDKLTEGTSDSQNTPVKTLIDQAANENSEFDPQHFDFVANVQIEQEFAAPIEELAVYALEEGQDTFSGGDVMFPGGYDQIFNTMVSALDIRLQQIVTEVNYSDDEVMVTTSDNTLYAADKVIVTVPLGVLKRGSIRFEPALPQAKLDAIDALGMGVFNKVYLGFPHVFWEADRDLLAYHSQSMRLWPSMFNLYKQYGDIALIAISTALEAIEVEAISDEQIVFELMTILRELYGDDIPQPNDVRITRWAQDPFSYGSYSFMKVGADSQSRRDLAQSVGDKLYFAGEATNWDYPATVHGALLSGLREAEKIR